MTGESTRSELKELICPEPDQRPGLWPWNCERNDEGKLTIGGLAASSLASSWGTPLFVIDLADLRGRAQVWQTAVEEAFWEGYGMAGASVYYASKALMCGGILAEVNRAGLGVDTASLGELTFALRAGVDPQKIALHGNNKTDEELHLAISSGVGRIVIDSEAEIERVAQISAAQNRIAPVMIRITTGVHAGAHEFISTGLEDQKFGLSVQTGAARRAAQIISENKHLELRGLHSHIGSQIFELDGFTAAARIVLQLRHELLAAQIPCPEIDLGGGYAAVYTGQDADAPTQTQVAMALAQAVREICADLDDPIPHVSIEPGRSIAAQPCVTLYRVGTVKKVALPQGTERLYVSVDGGMSDNIRTVLYGANYTATLANRISAVEPVLARVVGKHCESGDIVVRDVALPADIKNGDLIAVPATGAYGRSMASNYNMLTKPAVVAVHGGEVDTWIRRETIDDLIRLDEILGN